MFYLKAVFLGCGDESNTTTINQNTKPCTINTIIQGVQIISLLTVGLLNTSRSLSFIKKDHSIIV